jgi:transposase-like protein
MIKATIKGIMIEFETVKELKEFLGEDSEVKNRPSLSMIDKQPQCPLCFSTRVSIIKQTKNGAKSKFLCTNCGKEFTVINNSPDLKPRRKHRNTWSKAKRKHYLENFNKMPIDQLRKKYGIKTESAVFRLVAEFIKEIKQEKNKEMYGKSFINPNIRLKEQAMKTLRGMKK